MVAWHVHALRCATSCIYGIKLWYRRGRAYILKINGNPLLVVTRRFLRVGFVFGETQSVRRRDEWTKYMC